MTEARLGFAIDSSAALQAASDLDRLTASSGKAEQAAGKVGASATKASRSFGDLGPALDRIVSGIDRLNQTATGISTKMEALSRASAAAAVSTRAIGQAANDAGKGVDNLADKIKKTSDSTRSFGDQSAHVAAFRAEVERLTQKYQPLAQATRSYETAVSEIQQAHRLGVLTADQMTSALEKERLAYEKLKTSATSASSSVKAANQNSSSQGARRAAGLNAGYQLQDIAVSAAGGSSPALIALQQGTQLADAFAQTGGGIRGVASTAATAIGTLFNPLSLATIAFTGLTAAAIQYFSKTTDGANSTNELLAEQNEIIRQAAKSWGDALPSVKAYADQLDVVQQRAEGLQAVQALSKDAFEGLGNDLQKTNRDFTAAVRSLRGIDADPKFVREFTNAFSDLKEHLDDGTASLAQINTAQQVLAQALESYGTKEVAKFGDTFGKITGQINNAATAARRASSEFYSAIAGADNVQDIVSGSTFRDENGRTRATSSFIPRVIPTPMDRPNIELNGSDDDRIRAQIENQQRIQAADLRYLGARSPSQLAEAARARESANVIPDESDEQRVNRINLAGVRAQTEAEFRLKQAQEDRVRSLDASVDAQKNELSLVGQTGAAAEALKMQYQLIAQVREAAARAGVPADEKEIEMIKQKTAEYGRYLDLRNKAQLNADLDFQSRQAGRSSQDQQIANTLRQYGQSEDLNSPEAGRIRQQMVANDNRQAVTSFLGEFKDGLVKNGESVGEAFGNALKNALIKQADKLWDNLFGTIANALFPGSGDAQTSTAGIGLIGKLFGDGSTSNNPVMAGNMSAYASAIKSIESGGNYNALGPLTASGDRAYGAYQVMGANIPSWTKSAIGLSLTPSQFLGSQSAQDAVFNKYFGASVSKYGNPQDAASVWFSGRPMSAAGNSSDGFNTTPQYVAKFNAALGDAAKGVDQFGGGLGQLGQSLSTSFFPAAPQASGGSAFSWLGSLFGGAFKPIGAQASLAASGAITGLFADGTNYAPGGPSIIGENGPELLDLPQGSQVTSNHKLMSMLAANANQPARSSQALTVNVQGASGDDHVRQLVQQGVGAALSDYNTQQRRGGFGTLQARYASQKG